MSVQRAYFSASTIRRAERRDRVRAVEPTEPDPQKRLLDIAIDEADLTPVQRQIVTMVRDGFTLGEIGEAIDLPKWTVRRRYLRAVLEVKKARNRRVVGALEAYYQSLRVLLPTEEKHCPPGQEQCARLGYCPCRRTY